MIDNEVWKAVPIDGADRYEVSNFGRVRRKGDGAILSPDNVAGYPLVRLFCHGRRKQCYVHRLVALAFLDPVANCPYVDHIDSNKLNPRVDNLRWVSPVQNARHARDNGRFNAPKGEACGRSKLTAAQVRQIREYLKTESFRTVGKRFGVGVTTIAAIHHGRTWGHLV